MNIVKLQLCRLATLATIQTVSRREMASAEYRTIKACASDLVTGIAAENVDEIGDSLLAENLIASDVYDNILQATMTKPKKAREMVNNVTSKVKMNPKVEYPKFIAVLRKFGLTHLITIIEEKYGKHSSQCHFRVS